MAVIVFVYVYFFSLLRASSHTRYFVPVLIGIMIAYASTASVVGVTGKNSTNDNSFDSSFLVAQLTSYLVGIAISLAVNLLVFPEFAEQHLNENLSGVFLKTRDLSSSIMKNLTTTDCTREDHIEGFVTRNKLVAEIQTHFAIIDSEIGQATSEITYSHFSLTDYARITKGCKSVTAVLFCMNTVLNAPESVTLLMSLEYQNHVSDEMKAVWGEFDSVCRGIFDGLSEKLKGVKQKVESVDKLQRTGTEAIALLRKHQPSIFESMFDETVDVNRCASTREAKAAWERLLQINFFCLAIGEFISDLVVLHHQADFLTKMKRKLFLHWYIPIAVILKLVKYQIQTLMVLHNTKSWGSLLRMYLFRLKNQLLSPASIYGIKTATAILCLQLVMFIQPDFYKEWYMGGAVSTIVVAISPSLGQTYLSLPLTILGTSAGAAVAYLSVVLFGTESFGHAAFGLLSGIPFVYLMLFNSKTSSLGLLALLAYGNYICITFSNSGNSSFDKPSVYLYKVITVLSCALTFSVAFTLFLYPTFARHILRLRMSLIFHDLNMLYRKIMSSSIHNIEPITIHLIEDSEIKDLRNNILSQLVSLEPLMTFAAAEPRLESKFQTETYRNLIQCMYQLLDRLECVRLSVGEKPFDPEIKSVLKTPALMESRAELQQTIRLLLYIFSSAMLTKLKILPNLPNASKARDLVIGDYVEILLTHARVGPDFEDGCGVDCAVDPLRGIMPLDRQGMLATLNTEKWMRLMGTAASVREVSRTLDRFLPHLRRLFGVYPDIAAEEEEDGKDDLVSIVS
ncbi:UNVERIFIED_CONTAM: hypothetical protein HDU68_001933 [Siphonaria sp. JEL0065]|nr:hypothetical protein HDU68_001933 [Siphonaria sp. JEL0065]